MPALIGAVTAVVALFGVYNYVPLSWFEIPQEPRLGATITTILGSDTLSSSRTVINTNFANLNSDKFETTGTTLPNLTSAASLATVGTITSGTWNGTRLTVPYGGTGSTTLSQYQVLLGNGTSQMTTPVGWGTSGQFLTSNGAGALPSWQSATVNQTLDYTWTGMHNFSLLFATQASSTNATTTNLTVTGNTVGLPKKVYLTTSPTSVAGNSATTSVFSFTMPNGLLSTNNFVETTVYVSGFAFANSCGVTYEVGYGYSSTTVSIVFPAATPARSGAGTFKFILAANGTTNSQKLTSLFEGMATTSYSHDFLYGSSTALSKTATIAIDSTAPQNFGFNMKLSSPQCFLEPAIVTSSLFN